MPSLPPQTVVVIATGGTIAGTAARADDALGYQAGALSAHDLVAAVPALQDRHIEAQTLARLDSCDMDFATWRGLHAALTQALARPEVAGAVVTHGTDTLEETAYFLHRTLATGKPVVLTAAMRPATALSPDGPQNLYDAVLVAGLATGPDVLVVMGGWLWEPAQLRKLHGWRVDAFGGGDAGPLGVVEDRAVRVFRQAPARVPHAAAAALLARDPDQWPPVEIVTSHAGARGAALDALVDAGAQGIVVAGTGNGTLHHELRAAAARAAARGVRVVRASRCLAGGVVGASAGDALPTYGALTPVQARIELMLDLLAGA
ncbi:MAG: asparaginase [Rubrivivax sp.]|nr:asparaginase [Rubrivivax sp.]